MGKRTKKVEAFLASALGLGRSVEKHWEDRKDECCVGDGYVFSQSCVRNFVGDVVSYDPEHGRSQHVSRIMHFYEPVVDVPNLPNQVRECLCAAPWVDDAEQRLHLFLSAQSQKVNDLLVGVVTMTGGGGGVQASTTGGGGAAPSPAAAAAGGGAEPGANAAAAAAGGGAGPRATVRLSLRSSGTSRVEVATLDTWCVSTLPLTMVMEPSSSPVATEQDAERQEWKANILKDVTNIVNRHSQAHGCLSVITGIYHASEGFMAVSKTQLDEAALMASVQATPGVNIGGGLHYRKAKNCGATKTMDSDRGGYFVPCLKLERLPTKEKLQELQEAADVAADRGAPADVAAQQRHGSASSTSTTTEEAAADPGTRFAPAAENQPADQSETSLDAGELLAYSDFFAAVDRKMSRRAASRVLELRAWVGADFDNSVVHMLGAATPDELEALLAELLERCEDDNVLGFLALMQRVDALGLIDFDHAEDAARPPPTTVEDAPLPNAGRDDIVQDRLPQSILDGSKARIDARVAVEQHYSDFGAKGLQMLNSNVKVRWGRAKFMVVGKGAAGKSSFIRTLLGQPPVEEYDSTIGVDLKLTRTRDWAEREADTADLDEQLAKAQFLAGDAPPPTSAPGPVPAPAPAPAPALAPASASASASAPAPAVQVDEDDVAKSYRADLKARVQQDDGKTVAEEVSFTIWDYGGREVFYSLHHLFLTSNGVYVLAFDMRELLGRERFAPVRPSEVTAEPPEVVKVGCFALPRRRSQAAAEAAEAAEAAKAAEARAAATNAAADVQYRASVEAYNLLDSVEGALATLRFWLDSIALHAPDADVVLVGTYMDAVSRREDLEVVNTRLESIGVDESERTEYNRTDRLWFFPVDNMDRSDAALERTQRLRDVVVARVKDTDFVKRKVPLRWALLQEKMLADKTRNYMELDDVKKLALDVCGIEADEVTDELLPFLHELGVVVHLTATPTLANIVVTRPQWLLDNLARVICDPRHMDTHVEALVDAAEPPRDLRKSLERWGREGIATRGLLEWLWQGCDVDYFVDLMQEMLLASPVDMLSDALLVPSLLPSASSAYCNAASFDGPLAYVQFEFLPKGVFQRFVTSLSLLFGYELELLEVFSNAATVVFNKVEVLLTTDAVTKRVLLRFQQRDADAGKVPDRARLMQSAFGAIDDEFMKARMQPYLNLSANGTDSGDACVPLHKLVQAADDGDDRVLSLSKHSLPISSFGYFFPSAKQATSAACFKPQEVHYMRELAVDVKEIKGALESNHREQLRYLGSLRSLVQQNHSAMQRTLLSVHAASVPPLWVMTRCEGWRMSPMTTFEIRMLCQLTGVCQHDADPVKVSFPTPTVANFVRRAAPVIKATLMLLKVGSVAAKLYGLAIPCELPECFQNVEVPDFIKELTGLDGVGEHVEAAAERLEEVDELLDDTAERGEAKGGVAANRTQKKDLNEALETWGAADRGSSPATCTQLLELVRCSCAGETAPTAEELARTSGLRKAVAESGTCIWVADTDEARARFAELGLVEATTRLDDGDGASASAASASGVASAATTAPTPAPARPPAATTPATTPAPTPASTQPAAATLAPTPVPLPATAPPAPDSVPASAPAPSAPAAATPVSSPASLIPRRRKRDVFRRAFGSSS